MADLHGDGLALDTDRLAERLNYSARAGVCRTVVGDRRLPAETPLRDTTLLLSGTPDKRPGAPVNPGPLSLRSIYFFALLGALPAHPGRGPSTATQHRNPQPDQTGQKPARRTSAARRRTATGRR